MASGFPLPVMVKDRTIFDRTDHKFASIYIEFLYDKARYFLFGRAKASGYLAGFGGLAEEGETVLETALREFDEETIGSVEADLTKLEKHIRTDPKTVIFEEVSALGIGYTIVVYLRYHLSFQRTAEKFTRLRFGKSSKFLASCRRENTALMAVSVGHLTQRLKETPATEAVRVEAKASFICGEQILRPCTAVTLRILLN